MLAPDLADLGLDSSPLVDSREVVRHLGHVVATAAVQWKRGVAHILGPFGDVGEQVLYHWRDGQVPVVVVRLSRRAVAH